MPLSPLNAFLRPDVLAVDAFPLNQPARIRGLNHRRSLGATGYRVLACAFYAWILSVPSWGQNLSQPVPTNAYRSGAAQDASAITSNDARTERPSARIAQTGTRDNPIEGRLPEPQQNRQGPAAAGPQNANVKESYVDLNLAGSVSLPKLVEAVAQQMDVRFLYSANLSGRKVTVYTPARLPKTALPILLGSLLKGENLAIVDSDVPGWKRIVDIKEMASYAKPGQAAEVLSLDGPAAAVTQVIPVNNADISSLGTALNKFLSAGSNYITLPKNKLIIVTDYARNVQTIVDLMKIIDQPSRAGVIEFYETDRRSPESLIEQVNSLMDGGNDAKDTREYRLYDDASGKRILVAGSKEKVSEIISLLRRLDSGYEFQTKLYRLQSVSAARIESLVARLVPTNDQNEPGGVETSVDEEGNLLIVRAPADVHRQIRKLVETLDKPIDADESPIRFYKLKNANANEVLLSLLALQEAAVGQAGFGVGQAGFGGLGGLNVGGVVPAFGIGMGAGINQNFGAFGSTGNNSIGLPFNNGNGGMANSSVGVNANQNLPGVGGLGTTGLGANGLGANGLGANGLGANNLGNSGSGTSAMGGGVASLPGGARVSADAATNSLIVFAPANVQPLYEKLIESLDQRRPQVMIEAEIIAVNTSRNFSLGVEISGGDREGGKRLFSFTSFGLSEVDAQTGALSVVPSTGFNGVLVDPEVADVIVQALSSHSRSRVLASPKVLVNDNQTGTLESVVSVPFQSINTINTISSQSLGGEQQAGTVITVTPHINENDHLQLEFEVEFSTFSSSGGTATLPPPRTIDRVGSVVTIPDGKTVIVGGLKRTNESDSFTGLPFLEHIPVIRELTSLNTNDGSSTSFFLFIRPRILRDSRFQDLQYLSDVDSNLARISGDYPDSRPILIPCVQPPPTPSNSHHTPTGQLFPQAIPSDSPMMMAPSPMSEPMLSYPMSATPAR